MYKYFILKYGNLVAVWNTDGVVSISTIVISLHKFSKWRLQMTIECSFCKRSWRAIAFDVESFVIFWSFAIGLMTFQCYYINKRKYFHACSLFYLHCSVEKWRHNVLSFFNSAVLHFSRIWYVLFTSLWGICSNTVRTHPLSTVYLP